MNIPEATEKAKILANNWVYSNFKGFHDTKEMFEKVRYMLISLRTGKLNYLSDSLIDMKD